MRQMASAEHTLRLRDQLVRLRDLGALVGRHIRFVFVTGYGDHGLPTYRDWPTLRKPFQIGAPKRALQERLGTGQSVASRVWGPREGDAGT